MVFLLPDLIYTSSAVSRTTFIYSSKPYNNVYNEIRITLAQINSDKMILCLTHDNDSLQLHGNVFI